jgi:hypothetical protein
VTQGLKRIVISYDIACKYYINFFKRITDEAYPLLTNTELERLKEIELVWKVPKFHIMAHVDGCADSFSLNWTKNVGRTCGEAVESNWSSLGKLATSTREMGFGLRRDTLNDAMCQWNWRKAKEEGKPGS